MLLNIPWTKGNADDKESITDTLRNFRRKVDYDRFSAEQLFKPGDRQIGSVIGGELDSEEYEIAMPSGW
ncbi:hypothetical protein EMCRGX_G016880 [Ephydatia muelleri]